MLFSGETSGNKYLFVRHLAEGGMGRVDLAVREEGAFRRAYAIKRLREVYRDDSSVREMFVAEARIAGLLHHPNVVSVVDVGEDEEGPYLVMNYVEGISLAHLVTVTRERDELLPEQLVVRVIKQLSDGLHAAHTLVGHDGEPLELVHRDVSPQNVLIGFDGVARLTDFGIAKAVRLTEKTSTGILKGKFGYLSPELLKFHPPTQRSDLFSLGVVMFEALAADRLYGSKDPRDSARKILEEPPPDLLDVRGDVHPALLELLFELLAKEPEHRPQSAKVVSARLDAILADMIVSEAPLSIADYLAERLSDHKDEQRRELDHLTTGAFVHKAKPAKEERGKRSSWIVAIVVILFTAAGGIGGWYAARGGPPEVAEQLGAIEAPEPAPIAEVEAEPIQVVAAEAEPETEPDSPATSDDPPATERPRPTVMRPTAMRPTAMRPAQMRPRPDDGPPTEMQPTEMGDPQPTMMADEFMGWRP